MCRKPLQILPLTLAAGAVGTTAVQADEGAWDLIRGIDVKEEVTDTTYKAIKTFPAAIENGVEQFDITGFAMPYTDEDGMTQTLMLVSDMVTCPFCGLPDHAAALEVTLAEPVVIEDGQRITLRGALNLNHDPETWQAATLNGARLLGS